MREEDTNLLDIHFHKRHVPLPIALGVFLAVIVISGLIVYRWRERTLNYQVLVPKEETKIEELAFGSWPALENPDFFREVRERFISAEADFLIVDLETMKLSRYEQGELAEQFAVIAKGKPGTVTETPAGLYKIANKYDSALSSFAGVYMPWSMQFEGPYFIHGWPYYPGGKAVTFAYSGGCIRLKTPDAKKLYRSVKPGTPVLVYEKGLAHEEAEDKISFRFKGPAVSAKQFLAADLKNNFVFTELGHEEPAAIYSLTKLATALVAFERIPFRTKILVTAETLVPTSVPRLKAGERFRVLDLLYPLLLENSNQAASVLASFFEPENFIKLMNERLKAIGASQTSFSDPVGQNAENTATLGDLFTLAKTIYANRSFLFNLTRGDFADPFYGPGTLKRIKPNHSLSGDPAFAGGIMALRAEGLGEGLTVFNLKISAGERPVAIIVLNSSQPAEDIKAIAGWIERNF